MKYSNVKRGSFVSRPNRFTAMVRMDGKEEICHVKNTGRLGELLVENAVVYVQSIGNTSRKTKYDLIAVEKDGRVVNIDSLAPNRVVGEWLLRECPFGKLIYIKPEKVYKNSRFDFYIETDRGKMYIEVKGVTLEKDGVCAFPDAPTERGLRHIEELADCIDEGYGACVIFVVKLAGVKSFEPNRKTQPQFADALIRAGDKGVKILCLGCDVTKDTLDINSEIEINLGGAVFV